MDTKPQLDALERSITKTALDIHLKSLERAARSYELQGRMSTAKTIREDMARVTQLKTKVDTL